MHLSIEQIFETNRSLFIVTAKIHYNFIYEIFLIFTYHSLLILNGKILWNGVLFILKIDILIYRWSMQFNFEIIKIKIEKIRCTSCWKYR